MRFVATGGICDRDHFFDIDTKEPPIEKSRSVVLLLANFWLFVPSKQLLVAYWVREDGVFKELKTLLDIVFRVREQNDINALYLHSKKAPN